QQQQQQQQQQQAQVHQQTTSHAQNQQNISQIAQTIAMLQQHQGPQNLAPLINALGTGSTAQMQQILALYLQQHEQANRLQLQHQQQQAQSRHPSQQFGALQQQSADNLRHLHNLEQIRLQQRQQLQAQQAAAAAAEAQAQARRPSLLGDLPGYSRQQPITLLGGGGAAGAAASALAAPQISGTGASLFHAAAAAAAHAAKPNVASLFQAPSLLGGAQLATSDGGAQDDSDDADDDEAPQIQMEMEMEEEEEAPISTDQSEKISELVKHSGAIQHLKPKSSIGAPNGHGPDSTKEEINSDSEDEEEVMVNAARSKAWNIFFTQGAIHKVAKEQGNELYLSIIAENRAKSMEYHRMIDRENKSPPPVLYREPSQAPRIEELMAKIEMNGPDIIKALRQRRKDHEAVKNNQADTVHEAQRKWAESVEAWENSPRKKKQDERHREIFERAFPDIKGSRATVAAAARSGWLSAPPAAERVLRGTLGFEDDEKMRHGISIPPCQMRPPEGDETFEQGLNETNVIENCFEEHKKRMANWQLKWQVRERNAFKLAFQNYPKNFCAIAYHLPEKSTRNCVQFYYMTKLDNPSFKICHRQYQNKKRRKATAKPYKPPAMPNACDVASIHASVQEANDRLPPAPVGKQPDLKCSSCAVVMEPSTASTTRITRANLEALGVDAENSRICEKCRVLAANSRGGRCPIKGCTGSKRKVKSSKPFPPEYTRLEENEKKFILEQIEIHIDTVKICHLCAKRIVKEVQKLKQSTDYDEAFAAFCATSGIKSVVGAGVAAAGAALVNCEEGLSQQDESAVAAAAMPTGRKGSGRRSEDREDKAWTDDEIARLVDLNNKYGNDWRAIASRMRGRNEEECRMHFVRSTKESPPPGDEEPSVKEEVQSMAGSLTMDRSKEEDEV
ncbi:hypothetical protein PMAYCL1PPCAC_10140, partial [Pristionchus mayeri]